MEGVAFGFICFGSLHCPAEGKKNPKLLLETMTFVCSSDQLEFVTIPPHKNAERFDQSVIKKR